MIGEASNLILPPPREVISRVYYDIREDNYKHNSLVLFSLTEDLIKRNIIDRGDYRDLYWDFNEIRYLKNGSIQEDCSGYSRVMLIHTTDATYGVESYKYVYCFKKDHIGNPNYIEYYNLNTDEFPRYSDIYVRSEIYLQ